MARTRFQTAAGAAAIVFALAPQAVRGQDAPAVAPATAPAPDPEPVAPAPVSAPASEEPVPEVPVLNVPEMPPPDADYSADRDLFLETTTDAENARKEELAAEDRVAGGPGTVYQRWPRLSLGLQSVGGVFGSAVIALLGGSIGNAIDEGDSRFPLGGAHGPLFGGLAGSMIGAIGGVWGTGALLGKDTHPGWTALGGTLGTVVGAGAAAGFALGLEESNAATSLAIGSFLAFQVGGAVLFDELFTAKPAVAGARSKEPIQPPRTRTGPATDDPEGWLVPLGSGAF